MKNIKKYYVLLLLILIFLFFHSKAYADEKPRLWEIQSIDTMKTSRDKARAELYNTQYDKEIQKELNIIKTSGANYVAIDTPYDNEFLPYLKRWVSLARKTGLRVWFRGNFSSWEGWFDYPKNMSPEEHLKRTSQFIKENPGLFEDGDIFDACPECENAGYWPQPDKNQPYRDFIQKQRNTVKEAFTKINKNVYTNVASIIGGRARDVLDQKTFDALDNVVSIDHYIANPQSMADYINYFAQKFHTKTLVSEFGAPIPDINGDMTEKEQADFTDSVFNKLYLQKGNVLGVNYNVLFMGTTALLNPDYSSRQALNIITKYYTPAVIKGKVKNPLNDGIFGISVKVKGGVSVKTDSQGKYALTIPSQSVVLIVSGDGYTDDSHEINIASNGSVITQDFIIKPINSGIIYRIRMFLHDLKFPFIKR